MALAMLVYDKTTRTVPTYANDFCLRILFGYGRQLVRRHSLGRQASIPICIAQIPRIDVSHAV